ncbi:hypothetical protein L249_1786 [Ophiocordyceps polyrhachis-furcata BCC 54312]|uniref:Uncharacterized protein n=1 Tax=Ophiocordyceps polyrhachis-furcata BCC 54312 TaxID=1330021 RepID=A0A367LNZ5_9HYPO|nr:hypothetical protein L249_1786 [Ophiocordyceps polyrhachis-furcata BCC 54312]
MDPDERALTGAEEEEEEEHGGGGGKNTTPTISRYPVCTANNHHSWLPTYPSMDTYLCNSPPTHIKSNNVVAHSVTRRFEKEEKNMTVLHAKNAVIHCRSSAVQPPVSLRFSKPYRTNSCSRILPFPSTDRDFFGSRSFLMKKAGFQHMACSPDEILPSAFLYTSPSLIVVYETDSAHRAIQLDRGSLSQAGEEWKLLPLPTLSSPPPTCSCAGLKHILHNKVLGDSQTRHDEYKLWLKPVLNKCFVIKIVSTRCIVAPLDSTDDILQSGRVSMTSFSPLLRQMASVLLRQLPRLGMDWTTRAATYQPMLPFPSPPFSLRSAKEVKLGKLRGLCWILIWGLAVMLRGLQLD